MNYMQEAAMQNNVLGAKEAYVTRTCNTRIRLVWGDRTTANDLALGRTNTLGQKTAAVTLSQCPTL